MNTNPNLRALKSSAWRMLAGVMLVACTLLVPARDAQAMGLFEALDKVCGAVDGLCGPNYKPVVEGCFQGSDELKCAVAIIGVATGGASNEAIGMINGIASCAKGGLPLKPSCADELKKAGVPADKINEAYALATQCAGIDDVDDAIVCADALLDSKIADDADLGIPSWVNFLFDIYIDLKEKDYWGLVYHVGATVACAVANYFTTLDVCAFFEDIAEFAGDVADGAKAVGGALNNAGEKIFTDQTKHVPVVQFFNEYWLPEVDNYAKAIVVQKNTGYWSANVGEKFKHCRNYFDGHTMSEDKASRACSDMRDGTAASDNSFIDKGFSQLASRRGAIMLLPGLVKVAADARIAQLRTSGALKVTPLPGPQAQYDPWKGAAEVPGVESAVYRLYGLAGNGGTEETPLKRDAKTVNEAWRTKTVGYGAYMLAQAAKVAPATLNFPTSEVIAKQSIASGEKGIDFTAEVKTFVQAAQAERMKSVTALVNINTGLKESREKPLNDTLAMCASKATAICQDEVRARFKVCDAKAQAFYDANAALIGDFDNKRGQDAAKQWNEIRATCEADVRAYVNALPYVAGDTAGTASCKQHLGRAEELICSDGASFLACRKQVDIGKLKSCRQPGVQQVYTKSTGPAATGPGTINPGTTGISTGTLAAGVGAVAGAGIGKVGGSSVVNDAAATKSCAKFLGRADELLCPDASGYNACKVQVDAGKLKTCRLANTSEVYPKSAQAAPTAPAAPITPAAAKTCTSFLGRADEMLCPDAATFAACKAQVDSGKMKSCRQEGNPQAYTKPAKPAAPATPATTAVPTTQLGGSAAPSGNVAKPAGLGLSAPVPVPAKPKVDEAALKTCKPFLGRKDEMLCSDTRSFAACKTAVDIGQMKTCRMTGSQDVYKKP